MAKKRARAPLPSPEDVLAGRVPVRADQLFALVHDVNPTGQENPRERERYALKSRLQGLLLTRFGDEVEVHPDPANPDLVSLRHRSGLRDACHALVSQLPVEARALVRRRLDMEASATAAPRTDEAPSRDVRGTGPALPHPPATPEGLDDASSLHARGLAALEAYDYEEAQRLLTEAVERGAGAEAARALLELLVDLLADDAGALALEPRLSPAAASDAAVRGLLALAAARSGDVEWALKLVRGLSGPPAARVHAILAHEALYAGDLVRAAGHLANAKGADPALPEISALDADLERARQDERKPSEEALLALHAAGDRDAAEASARALLSRWPDSATGRRVLREIEETRRRERALALSRDGAAVLDRGDAAEAVRLLAQALATDPESAGVSELLSRARQTAASQADEAAIGKVVAALATPALHEGLVAFAALTAALRARVRALSPEPRLDAVLALVEDILSSSPGEEPRAAVDAARALSSAEDALRANDPAAALHLLETHARPLTQIPRAEALAKGARHRLAAERAARARAALARVRTALDAGDLDRATNLLHEVRKADLDGDGHAEHGALAGRVHEEQTVRRDHRESEIRNSARRALRLRVSAEPAPADELADIPDPANDDRDFPCLSADGRRLVLVEAWGDWLFVRVVDVERGEVVRRISLRTPHAVGEFPNVLLDGERVRVVGDRLGLVTLDLATDEVERATSLAGFLPASSIVERTRLLPGTGLVWVEITTGPEREFVSYLVDSATARARAKLPFDPAPAVVLRGASSILVVEDRRRARLLTLDGLPAAGNPPVLPLFVHAAAPAPSGPVVLLAGPAIWDEPVDDEAEELAGPLRLLELSPGPTSSFGRSVDLPGTRGDIDLGLATSLGEGLTFALTLVDQKSRIFTLRSGLQLADEPVTAPAETVLFVDTNSTRVVAGCWWGERFAPVPLGRETRWPEWKASLHERDPYPPGVVLGDDLLCRSRSAIANARSLALYGELDRQQAVEARVGELLAKAETGDEHEALLGALERLGPRYELLKDVETDLVARFPDHPAAVLRTLRDLARENRWDEILDRARAFRLRRDVLFFSSHIFHLEAVALARRGDLAGALELVEEIRREGEKGACHLDGLLSLLHACLSEKRPGSPLGRLVFAVRNALAARAAGDPARVVTLLDRGLVWASRVFQAHALLAAAWLDLDAATPRDLFRKRRALARLLDLRAQDHLMRRDLPPLPRALDAAAIETIAARAREFLEGEVAAGRESDLRREEGDP